MRKHTINCRIHKPLGADSDYYQGVQIHLKQDPSFVVSNSMKTSDYYSCKYMMLSVVDPETGAVLREYPAGYWEFCEVIKPQLTQPPLEG